MIPDCATCHTQSIIKHPDRDGWACYNFGCAMYAHTLSYDPRKTLMRCDKCLGPATFDYMSSCFECVTCNWILTMKDAVLRGLSVSTVPPAPPPSVTPTVNKSVFTCPSCSGQDTCVSDTFLSMVCSVCKVSSPNKAWTPKPDPNAPSVSTGNSPPLLAYPKTKYDDDWNPLGPTEPRFEDYGKKTIPTCISCDAELCEALDRTPADPLGPLVRCIRCKPDNRKGSR